MVILLVNLFFLFQDDYPKVFASYSDDTKAIIIFAHDNRSELYEQSLSLLIHDPIGMDNRDIKIFEIFIQGGIGPDGESYSNEEVNSIRKYYKIEPAEFKVVLIHKNFEEIFQSDKPLPVNTIFEKFDQDN
jgi:hypothetical protein